MGFFKRAVSDDTSIVLESLHSVVDKLSWLSFSRQILLSAAEPRVHQGNPQETGTFLKTLSTRSKRVKLFLVPPAAGNTYFLVPL